MESELEDAYMRRANRLVGSSGWRYIALILLIAAAPLAAADPALAEKPDCPAATREQALALGDQLRKDGVYQRAGKCYEAAGE